MLGKSFRIRKKEDFDRVFRFGKPLFFGDIACKFLKNPENTGFRVGFSFSKKHVPLAISRHRLRRRLSHAVLERKNAWPEGVDLVFFTQRKPKDVNYATMERIASDCLDSIRMAK